MESYGGFACHGPVTDSVSPFCMHGRLKLFCASCKPAAPKPASSAGESPAPKAPKAAKVAVKREPKASTGGGRKEMLPQRSRPKRVSSRAEAEQAVAWWVKKDDTKPR